MCLLLEYVGLPVPGESLMLMYGFLYSGGVALSILKAAAGTFFGSLFAYIIGYRFGEVIVLKLGRPFHITKEKLDKVDAFIKRHEAFYIITSRFIPGFRHIVPYLCGISRIGFIKNLLYNVLSSVIWCSCFICLGRIAGSHWQVWGKYIAIVSLSAFAVIISVMIIIKVFNKNKANS